MTVAGRAPSGDLSGLYSYLAGGGWWRAPCAPDEIENWGSARTAAEWAPKDRPKEGRCPFHYERGRRRDAASMIIACENPPSFRREFHFHFPPPPPIPSKEHDLWMHHHHHHFSSLPLLNYQKKKRKKAGFGRERGISGVLFISHIFFASLSLQRPPHAH